MPRAHLAACDLGSNSFHLIIGRDIGGQLSVLDRLRDPVRMAAGLDDSGRLSEETVERMLESHGGNVTRAAESAGVARRYFQILKARVAKKKAEGPTTP